MEQHNNNNEKTQFPFNCSLVVIEITEKMSKSRNFDELKHIWVQWHGQSGGKMRSHYQNFVELSNKAAQMNSCAINYYFIVDCFYWFVTFFGSLDYSDTGAYWLRNYESETFQADIEELWQTIKPFYQQLHAYVRAKLRAHYGEDKIPKNQPIPAHLLGNMWAQSWGNIEDLVLPYPGKTSIDVTPEMLKQVSLI